MASKKINVSELDFDNIKQNLKTFLQGQETFQDYNFEGSGLSVLLDILSYNTHYNNLYNNLAVNEMFLDSARKRNSVVSLAKMLNYAPKSAACSKALITLTVTTPSAGPAYLVLPSMTPFTTIINGSSYTFYTKSSYTAVGSTSYTFSDVEIVGGTPLSFKYTVAVGSKFIIPNQNVDTSTMNVRIQESESSSVVTSFNLAENITKIKSTSNVYWVKEIDNGLYELTFGDGIIGTALTNGNIVHIDYMISDLGASNDAKIFSYNGSPLLSGNTIVVATQSPASGGVSAEDIESIRFVAPKFYSAQNRAVTAEDYESIIYANVPYAESVSVWGGEDAVPPIYGKMFICVKPYNADVLTPLQKTELLSTVVHPKAVLTITPEIVDPEYINVVIDSTVYYNEFEAIRSATDIQTIVKDAIINYDNTELQRFDKVLRYSKLTKLIDESEPSIINNITTVILKRSVVPKYNVTATYTINLLNPIYSSGVAEDSVLSSGFYIAGNTNLHYLVDDGVGGINLFYISSNQRVVTKYNIGTVDYANGIITINGLNITSVYGNKFIFTIKPQSNDVASIFTQIVRISQPEIIINVLPDSSANGDFRGGTNYKFTSARI
jgi:hypothetical protein